MRSLHNYKSLLTIRAHSTCPHVIVYSCFPSAVFLSVVLVLVVVVVAVVVVVGKLWANPGALVVGKL
jgi:hypothetical protein